MDYTYIAYPNIYIPIKSSSSKGQGAYTEGRGEAISAWAMNQWCVFAHTKSSKSIIGSDTQLIMHESETVNHSSGYTMHAECVSSSGFKTSSSSQLRARAREQLRKFQLSSTDLHDIPFPFFKIKRTCKASMSLPLNAQEPRQSYSCRYMDWVKMSYFLLLIV